MMNPARRVIEKCGGVDAVMRICGRSRSRVLRWTYPKERGGTGGLIPAEMQQVLLKGARNEGRDLRPDDFFDVGQDASVMSDDAPGAAA